MTIPSQPRDEGCGIGWLVSWLPTMRWTTLGARSLLAEPMADRLVDAYGTSARGPLVIDSPNQQDQDQQHLVKMLQFIRDEVPKDTQLILGLVDTAGITFSGSEIVLDRKHSLLGKDEFEELGPEVQRYIDRSLET